MKQKRINNNDNKIKWKAVITRYGRVYLHTSATAAASTANKNCTRRYYVYLTYGRGGEHFSRQMPHFSNQGFENCSRASKNKNDIFLE